MKQISNIFSNKKAKQKLQKTKIIIDRREKNSLVPSELAKLGLETEFKHLPVADYIIGKTAIERKTISDFKSSIINKRIIGQLLEIKQFPKHFLILEGFSPEEAYNSIGLHENAFRGLILSIILEHQVPIIYTENEKDTAKFLSTLAKKQTKTDLSIRASKILLSDKEQLQFIVEGFPQIGPATAKKLLNHYKTLNNLTNSSLEELQNLVGKKAEELYRLLHKKY